MPEVSIPGSTLTPADILVDNFSQGFPAALDFSISHALRPSCNLAGVEVGKAASQAAEEKIAQYEAPCSTCHWKFVPVCFGNNRLYVWWGEHDYWTFVSFSFRAEWHRCRRIRSTFVVPLGFISFFLNWEKSVSCLPSFTGGSPSVEAGIWFHLFLSSLLRAHHTLFQNCCSPIFIPLFSFFTYCHPLPVFTFFFLCLPHLSFFSSIFLFL